MVNYDRGKTTTTCVVQKEKTQTRITFNNLSANLTVNDLYKYVQLQLDEDRPFELTLVRDKHHHQNGASNGNDVHNSGPLKVGSRQFSVMFLDWIAIWLVVFIVL